MAGWLRCLPLDLRARPGIQALRQVPEARLQQRHFSRSVALAARLRGVRSVAALGWLPPLLADLKEGRRPGDRHV